MAAVITLGIQMVKDNARNMSLGPVLVLTGVEQLTYAACKTTPADTPAVQLVECTVRDPSSAHSA